VRNPLSSPRLRRRLLWLAPLVGLGALAAGLVLAFPNTGKRHEVFDNRPVQWYPPQKAVRAGPRIRDAVLLTTSLFIKTAVRRQNVDASWPLVDATLKEGLTRREWARGNIPVVPYPAAGIADWRIDWSYANDIAMDVVLVPLRGASAPEKSFLVELKRRHGRWLVVDWQPHGVSLETDIANASKGQQPPAVASSLGTKWLVAPLIALAAILVVPLAVFAGRGWLRQSKAEREYRASLRS
jgi:hypothetical protein